MGLFTMNYRDRSHKNLIMNIIVQEEKEKSKALPFLQSSNLDPKKLSYTVYRGKGEGGGGGGGG